MEKFVRGQRVHVEYDGVVENERTSFGTLSVKGSDGRLHVYDDGVTITPANPESWPPEAGDIWKSGDREWIVTVDRSGYAGAWPVDDFNLGESFALSDNREKGLFLAKNPVLMRRRER